MMYVLGKKAISETRGKVGFKGGLILLQIRAIMRFNAKVAPSFDTQWT